MPASRFFRPLLVTALTLAGLGELRAAPASADYFSAVTYNMVITRESTLTGTASSERRRFKFEIFDNRDLLRVILGAQEPAITNLRGWALVARGNSASFTDTSSVASLVIGARHRDGRFFPLPPGAALTLDLFEGAAPTNSVRVVDRGTLVEDPADDTLVSETRSIAQLAELEQAIPAVPGRTLQSTGTIDATGYLSHGTVYGTFSLGGATIGPVYRPTSASYRASGPFTAPDTEKSGIAEVLIRFGAPVVRTPQAD